MDIVYWINLPSAVERRQHMKKVLSDDFFKNVPTVRIVANKPEKNIKDNYKLPNSSFDAENINRVLRVQQYACLLSHLNTIREFSKSKYETALILEDDVTLELKPYWTPIQKVLQDAPKDWEVLKLNSSFCYKKSDPLYTQLKFPCNEKTNPCKWSAAAYVIKKSAAKKLMRMWDGKRYVLPDSYYVSDYVIFQQLKTYDYKYQYFIIRANNNSQLSTIQLKNYKTGKERRRKILWLNRTRKLKK
jgi:GR25 family glycosyltransferase involved in LPS biosynthesis